jgi:hypothetical protein
MCWSGIEEVQTSVDLSVPDWKIYSTKPDESQVKLVEQGISTQLNLNRQGAESESDTRLPIDGTILALLRNSDGLTDTDLLKADNAKNMVVKLEDYYKRIFAQIISSEARVTNGTLLQFNAEVMDAGHLRIVQSTISTRILEAFLAIIVLCAMVQTLMLDFEAVVPANLSSIAGVASLLGGSRLMEMIPNGSCSLTDDQLERCFDGYVFSLGYGGQGVGIDVGEAEKPERTSPGIITTLFKWRGRVNWTKLQTRRDKETIL